MTSRLEAICLRIAGVLVTLGLINAIYQGFGAT